MNLGKFEKRKIFDETRYEFPYPGIETNLLMSWGFCKWILMTEQLFRWKMLNINLNKKFNLLI